LLPPYPNDQRYDTSLARESRQRLLAGQVMNYTEGGRGPVHEVVYELGHVFNLPVPSLALHASVSFHQHRWLTGTAYDDDDYLPSHYQLSMEGLGGYYHAINGTRFKGSLSDFGLNESEYGDFTHYLYPATDVDVNGVAAATAFNALVFAVLMISYEILRRLVPSVYASKRQQATMRGEKPSDQDNHYLPFDWLMPVFGVPWSKVRKAGGLDAYMFLRYIRMCLRITSVSAFWGIVILWPVYGNGGGPYSTLSWYHFSMANIDQGSWRIWVPTVFIYLFSAYIFFTMKQEYKHFVELRMEFLGKGPSAGIDQTQQTYSVMVERIPSDLKSDRALYDYFNRLLPGKVHSSSIILNVPDLEVTAQRTQRVTRRLEKSIAYYYATGQRPTHISGRPRITLLGIECSPLEVTMGRACHATFDIEEEGSLPPRGVIVDSIDYYTHDLEQINQELFLGQRKKARIAETGNISVRANDWISKAVDYAAYIGDSIIGESLQANSLTLGPTTPSKSPNSDASGATDGKAVSAKRMFSDYGSFDDDDLGIARAWSSDDESLGGINWNEKRGTWEQEKEEEPSEASTNETGVTNGTLVSCVAAPDACASAMPEKTIWRRMAGRLGLDFFVALIRVVHKRARTLFEGVVGSTMSSTGFVTFYSHEATTVAACAQLTHKPNALEVFVAPEPRDILWDNANVHKDERRGREIIVNVALGVGVIFWSIPLAAIQAFAKAEQIALIPGFEWVLHFDGGNLKAFINGYLPVVALLVLISALPFVFQSLAISYERRKTKSCVAESVVVRYFYYQVANIYVTVTAGSIWKAASEILMRPPEILQILGDSIPMMVGYFMSLMITKILAGLPMLMLRSGALSRMCLLRMCFSRPKLTQRELDEVYRKETIFYGWEYPTQLLVIMIAFAYACISPIILPVTAAYFLGALVVYKKQVLYVYSPTYESGGRLFPIVCDRTLVGLIISQLTFIGYSLIREGKWQPLFLSPLPCVTLYMMYYFRFHYAKPSLKLSFERAVELDHRADIKASGGSDESYTPNASMATLKETFKDDFYRQPVLTAEAGRPLPYRRKDGMDELTANALKQLEGGTSRYQMMLDEKQGTTSGIAATKNSARRKLDVSLADSFPLDAPSTDTHDTPSRKHVAFEPREIV